MSKSSCIRAALAAGAVVVLAGCGASASSSDAAAGSTSSAAPSTATSSPSATASATSNSFVAAGSIPFPVAVGNTWVYETIANIDNAHGIATNKVVSVVPVSGGHQVTMAETSDLGGVRTSTRPVYTFYSNGKIGYPITPGGDVSVVGSGVLWPNAADLASGKAFHSVLRVRVSGTGGNQCENADVTVQGTGTVTVTVPAGTYRAIVVTMTMTENVGSYHSTQVVETWEAAGTGPVKTEVLISAGGRSELTSTEELLSFTRG
jgi:hypothetical protein